MSVLHPGQPLTERFALVRRLGAGGMAEVWLVHDRELDEQVVAKILPPEAPEGFVTLLRHECRQARRLVHPNIVRVFDFHRDEQTCFVTMEHVDGERVDRLRGRPPGEIVEMALAVADALEFAHGLGVVHRDLKAANVLIDPSGRPRILDFGIAGLLDPGKDGLVLSGGGSPGRSSPEQLAGSEPRPTDDIYALGVLIRELSGSSRSVPDRLRSLVDRMVDRDPERRPADMTAVKAELEAIRAEADPAGTSAAEPDTVAPDVRLTPPPRVERVEAVRHGEGGTSARAMATPRTPRWVPWVTTLGVVALGAAMLAVFVWLPRWAEKLRLEPRARTVEPAGLTEEDGDDDPVTAPQGEPIAPSEEVADPAPESVSGDAPEDEGVAESVPPSVASETASPTGDDEPARRDAAFSEAMSEGLEAEDRRDWNVARAAFARAETILPESPEVADAMVRVDTEVKLEAIIAHRSAAAEDEANERWADATAHYADVLALDPTIRFARAGHERAGARANLDSRLEYHIQHPDRLSADDVLDEATRLVAAASDTEPAGPRLGKQIAELESLLEVAGEFVSVRLESDELTDVMVYKVGHLGNFEHTELELRPGRYTVVGSRDGFRDVRRELVIVAGETPLPVVVRCEEKI